MPGGFHPFHAGHLALYDSAREAFPGAEVFVAATNDTSARPFPFAVKEKLAKLAGIAPGHFVQVKSPFRAEEITSKFDPARDRLIFVRSEKDANKPPQAGGIKRDGSAAYLQPLAGQTNIRPFKEHAYMAYLPTVEFGPGMTSATEIRTAWPTLNEKRKTALVMSLYPRTQSNPKLANTVVKLLDAAIGTQNVAEDATGSFDYDQLSAMPMKDRLALYKTNPELKNLYNTEFKRRIDAELNNYAWMTPEEQVQYKQLAAKDQAATQATGTRTTYGAERYLKQLFQQKMDAKKAAAMLKVHWAPLKQLESFLQGKVNNKTELSAYLAPNAESLGKTRWGSGSNPTVGIVLDGHITIGGRGDLGSDIIDAVPGQRRQQKYASRPGQIDPTLSMDTSVHHEVLIDNWKIKEIVLPADIPPEVDRLVQQYKIPVRRLSNPQAVAEGESVSLRDMVNVVDRHYPKYYAELSGSDISDRQFERAIVNAYKKIMQKQGVAESTDPNIWQMPLRIGKYLDQNSAEFQNPSDYLDSTDLIEDVEDLIDAGVEPQVVTMNPEQLFATQDWLSNYGSDGPMFEEYSDLPVVYKKANEFYILDGHHRTSAALKKHTPVKVYLFAPAGVTENFADGRNPQDKGDAKRHGINTKASVSSLRKTAKQGGRKGQLAHWLANMKSGRAKNEDTDYLDE